MKITYRFAAYAVAYAMMSFPIAAHASPVMLPNAFTQGSMIKSSEVNDNFSAVKAAVDDSQAQIDAVKGTVEDQQAHVAALEAAKQNKVTGTCPAGSAIGAIKADGTVTCDSDVTYTATSPLAIAGHVIGLQAGAIMNSHINANAAIAASKIFGDAGIEYSAPVARVDLPNNSSTPTVVSSITLTAPSAGTILVMVNGGVHLSDTHMLAVLGIGVSPTAYAASNSQWASSSSTTILPVAVTGPGAHTFHALANEVDPTNVGTSWVTDVQLVALFIPKRY